MANYIVTGGAGFIGANLVKRLLDDGHQAIVLDNYVGGKIKSRLIPGVKYVRGDVRSERDLKKVFKNKFDGVFHLAALPRVIDSIERPLETHEVNVTGTLKTLIAARDAGVKRLVFASSAAVYGNQQTDPMNETLAPAPQSPYGLHKFIGENYCRLFADLYKIQTVSLRFFNVYGPYFDPAGPYALVVGKFLNQRTHNQPLTVRGDGEFFRDYIHVSDVVEANILAMTKNSVGSGEVINIGTGAKHSVNELAKFIGGPTIQVPALPGEMKIARADIGKAKELLGWLPKIALSQGILDLKKEWGIE